MMSIKAVVKTTWIVIVVVIIIVAALGGVLLYNSGVLAPKPGVPVPGFVNDNKILIEGGAKPQWLDPHVSYNQYDYEIQQHSVEMLLWYNGNSTTDIIPWLSDNWTPSYNTFVNTYNVTLRQGIKFQDGTPLNSTAVWFSLNRLLIIDGTDGEGNHGGQAAWILQQVLDTGLSSSLSDEDQSYSGAWVKKVLDQKFIEIVDDYTFKINVQTKTTKFPYLFAQTWAAIISPTEVIKREYAYHNWGSPSEGLSNLTKYFVRAAGIGDTYFNVPRDGWKIGTGPYNLTSYDSTTYKVVLRVNSNYWGGPSNFQYGEIGVPKIKEIDFSYVQNINTRLLHLEAGTATGIGVNSADLYNVVDRDAWLTNGILKSTISGVMVHGPFTQLVTDWLNFETNVTDASGHLLKFQPMADRRIRLAIASSVNLTDINIFVNNKLGQVATNLIPPGTAPSGSYNGTIKAPWSYNLKSASELLVDAMKHPMTSFVDQSGRPITGVDNTFGDTNGDGKADISYNIQMYVGSEDELTKTIMATMATNLNAMAADVSKGGNATGLLFSVATVPGGQQYTLAARHQIYMYWGGWIAEYNHVIDWLSPMYLPSTSYPLWNRMNFTALDRYVENAIDADAAGNVTALLQNNYLANKFATDQVLYFYLIHPMAYFVRSSFLKGWYFNAALATEYFAPMHYETTP